MKDLRPFKVRRQDAAVLIIDVQEKLLPIMPKPEEIIKQNEILLHIAKAYNLPTFYTEQYPKGLGPTPDPLLSLLKETEAVYASKTAYNGLTPEIVQGLKKTGCNQVIIGGIETHICVYQTTRSLLEEGYEVVINQDAVGSRFPANKANALDLFTKMGATVMNTETIMFDLMGDAKDPHFKELQALIK